MARAQQKRTLETRARLIAASEEIIVMRGFQELRVEEVVLRAGTAKGTFFAHFKDKDALMDLIIGGRINQHLDRLAERTAPKTVAELVEALMPLSDFMTSERYVFDVILRYSGAAAVEEIGAIAMTLGRQIDILERWLSEAQFSQNISPLLQAEGVQAFLVQAMGTNFCALHNTQSIQTQLMRYLTAWLRP
jgi:AcrR family transcriptional regulator